MSAQKPTVSSETKSQGIFGFGLSHNDHLDLLNIVVLGLYRNYYKVIFF